MNTKQKFRITIDLLMTISLLALMGYIITGDMAHEIIGTAAIVLWIIHTMLNRKWYTSLTKGRYSFIRTAMTVINILLLLSASGLIISGIILSSYIFSFLGIDKGLAFARTLHMVSSYWYFVLSSLHLGLHWNRVINSINKYSGGKRSVIRTVMLNTAAISMSCFGIHVFIQQQIASYMFMRTFFVYFDFEKSPLLFFFEYLCMMVMFASASYYFSKLPGYIRYLRRLKAYEK